MSERVLIVDDDDAVRDALLDELSGSYEVTAAASGLEALDLIARAPYDAVVSDLRMPDVSGLDVLEFAHGRDPEVIRLLLTGHLDEQAQRRTLVEGAPFKIGKPWHDEVEVTLRRAFEHRAETRRLRDTIDAALGAASLDDDLALADGVEGIAALLVDRGRRIEGIHSLSVLLEAGARRVMGSFDRGGAPPRGGWHLDLPLSEDGEVRLLAAGRDRSSHELCRLLGERTRRFLAKDTLARLAQRAAVDADARGRLFAFARRAAVGAMSAATMHELASLLQCLRGDVGELEDLGGEGREAVGRIAEVSERVLALFKAMRAFLHGGSRGKRYCRLGAVCAVAVELCKSAARHHCQLRLGPVPDVDVEIDEPLVVQVLVNLIRNAIEASPPAGAVDVTVTRDGGEVVIAVEDDGPGLPEEMQGRLFEAFASTKDARSGTGLGLALSAQIARDHGGTLVYARAAGRGARFAFRLPAGD